MIQLPEVQAETLKSCFEEVFDENERYFDLVEIDEIFNVLIGGDVDETFFIRLDETSSLDDMNLAFICFLNEWMDMLETFAVTLTFFETAQNVVDFKKVLNKIMKAI
tara:strand:+ start:2425 stop:2745 length:321 start_codon:yes stop_codon:yes gene_type:complete